MKKLDIGVAVLLLLLAAGLFAYNLTHQSPGTMVEIARDGEVIQVVPLAEDQVIDLAEDDEYNQIIIEAGEVRMTKANCRDQLCVHTAPLRSAGRAIVCLPHRISVVIVDFETPSELDAISE